MITELKIKNTDITVVCDKPNQHLQILCSSLSSQLSMTISVNTEFSAPYSYSIISKSKSINSSCVTFNDLQDVIATQLYSHYNLCVNDLFEFNKHLARCDKDARNS